MSNDCAFLGMTYLIYVSFLYYERNFLRYFFIGDKNNTGDGKRLDADILYQTFI